MQAIDKGEIVPEHIHTVRNRTQRTLRNKQQIPVNTPPDTIQNGTNNINSTISVTQHNSKRSCANNINKQRKSRSESLPTIGEEIHTTNKRKRKSTSKCSGLLNTISRKSSRTDEELNSQ